MGLFSHKENKEENIAQNNHVEHVSREEIERMKNQEGLERKIPKALEVLYNGKSEINGLTIEQAKQNLLDAQGRGYDKQGEEIFEIEVPELDDEQEDDKISESELDENDDGVDYEQLNAEYDEFEQALDALDNADKDYLQNKMAESGKSLNEVINDYLDYLCNSNLSIKSIVDENRAEFVDYLTQVANQ